MNVEVRDARLGDKGALMEFVKGVWGGHDYIPEVWDKWLAARGARMFAALVDGVPVGMNRVRFLEDGSGWLEGARVHPDFRGRGLATLLADRAMQVARSRGVDVLRLTSGSWNRQAHRHIARIGFREAARFSVYTPAKARLGVQKGVRKATEVDLKHALTMAEDSKEFRVGGGVFWDSFAAMKLSGPTLRRLIRKGSVYFGGDSMAIAMPGGEGIEHWKQVCFLTGETEGAIRLVKHTLGMRERFKPDRRIIFVPRGSRLIAGLRDSGMERDFSLVLFERHLTNG